MIKIDNSILFEDYTIIDIETTGLSKYCKVIEFAALKIRNNKIVDQYSTLVNPKCSIPESASCINHIYDDMVKDSKTIKELSCEISNFLGNDILIAHYAKFDIGVLNRQLVDGIKNYYVDSIDICKQAIDSKKYSLSYLTNYLNISQKKQSHRALDDTIDTFNLINKIIEIANDREIALEINLNKVKKVIGNYLPSEIKKQNHKEDFCPLFCNKHFVFTGIIENMSRKQAMQIVVNKGGLVGSSVIKKTNYLVVGSSCGKTKLNKAKEKIDNNEDIKIITDTDFLKLIKQ